jgi:hypothetical protein
VAGAALVAVASALAEDFVSRSLLQPVGVTLAAAQSTAQRKVAG